MKFKKLGRTHLSVSEVGLGTMAFGNQTDEPTAFAIMDVAYAAGVRYLDTADIYPPPGTPALRGRSERIVGTWLRSRGVRAEMLISTKVGKPAGDTAEVAGLRRTHILRACDDSLRRLETDWIDLYLMHVPDLATQLEETLAALNELVQVGKVRYIGCSNFSAALLLEALSTGETPGTTPLAACQDRYNLLSRAIERQILPLCALYNVGAIAYSPLAGGMLTDLQAASQSPSHPVAQLHRLARERGHSLTHVALGWVLSQPRIASAVVGASHPEQLQDSLNGVGLEMDEEVKGACDAIALRSTS